MTENTENLESTQPSTPPSQDDTQPLGKVKKKTNWKSILIGIVGFILLIGLGAFSGYKAGESARINAEDSILTLQLSEQFSFALVDIQFGRYENARQRLEFIISKDPGFPGAQEKLTEVLVASTIPTAAPTITPTVTPDFSGAESAFARAQELIRAQDWPGALGALDTIRKLDPTYKTAQVDSMYYFALRNNGYDLITKHGNLEGGIYFLTLAERFGPLDNSAIGIRDGARSYITGASFWELDWKEAVNYFSQVGAGWPSLWDGTMTASQRYFVALMRYGDELFAAQSFCDANSIYEEAALIGVLDATAANNAARALAECNALSAPPTVETLPTITATTAPTEAPTGTPDP